MRLPRGARLADIQAQQVEVGRIRLGTTETKQGRRGSYQSPVKLDRFRLTSRSEQLIKQASAVYGGDPEPWQPQNGGAPQHQVVIEQVSIRVIVPPDPLSQYYEQWTAGKCVRRCDGLRELIEDIPCVCGPDPASKKAQGCKPTTRVSLMLADLPGVGVWRLESHGYNAAAELPAVVDLLAATGGHFEARLEMEERSSLIPDPRDPAKQVTSRFMVPVIHVEATPAAIVGVVSTTRAEVQQRPEPAQVAVEGAQLQALPAGTGGHSSEPTAPGEDPEVMKQQWKVHTWFEDNIGKAELGDLERWAEKIRAEARLLPEFRDNLLAIVARRVDLLAAQGAPADDDPPLWDEEDTPAADPPTAPPPPAAPAPAVEAPAAAAAAVDRAAMWMQVNAWGGGRGHTLSKLRELYGEFEGTGKPVSSATGEQLQQFLEWAKRNNR